MDKYIDSNYSSEKSIVLRYHKGLSFDGLTEEDLKAASLKEGSRILRLLEYKGVEVWLVDESTLMSSGTFKALEACFTMALCKKKKYKKVVFSSGANLGSALSLYGEKCGVETFFFHPANTSWKLDNMFFDAPSTHLISVDKAEKEVKKAALLFSKISGTRHIPEMEWRFSATGLRALFVFEFILGEKTSFDWISQAVCAGYGPIGFYNMAQKLIKENAITRDNVPKFLGVQQEALSPMAKAWRKRHNKIEPEDIVCTSTELLDQTLYNTNPDSSYPLLYTHLVDFGGELCSLDKADYERYLALLLKELSSCGINLNKRSMNGMDEILENAGLINLAGTLKAVDDSIIKEGEKILSFFTGGAGNYSGREAVPEFEIRQEDDLEVSVREYLDKVLGK